MYCENSLVIMCLAQDLEFELVVGENAGRLCIWMTVVLWLRVLEAVGLARRFTGFSILKQFFAVGKFIIFSWSL